MRLGEAVWRKTRSDSNDERLSCSFHRVVLHGVLWQLSRVPVCSPTAARPGLRAPRNSSALPTSGLDERASCCSVAVVFAIDPRVCGRNPDLRTRAFQARALKKSGGTCAETAEMLQGRAASAETVAFPSTHSSNQPLCSPNSTTSQDATLLSPGTSPALTPTRTHCLPRPQPIRLSAALRFPPSLAKRSTGGRSVYADGTDG